jgi:hypothetical protein
MGHTLLVTIAAVALVVAALALAARYAPGVIRPVLVTAALAPYLALGAPAAVILFAILHNWIGVILAGALTVAGIAVRLRWYLRGRPMPESASESSARRHSRGARSYAGEGR